MVAGAMPIVKSSPFTITWGILSHIVYLNYFALGRILKQIQTIVLLPRSRKIQAREFFG